MPVRLMTGLPNWREVSEGRIARAPSHPRWPASASTAAATASEIRAAVQRIRDYCVTTPVRAVEVAGARSVAKLESLQSTGSFKIRGAANRVLTLSDQERAAGVVTASSGNHGIAVARLASQLGVRAVVCVPRHADPVKLCAIRAAGAEILWDTDDFDASAAQAVTLSAQRGLCFIHPFDDLKVIAGHATVGIELAHQVPDAAAVLIPLSGGGLAAGVACALRTAGRSARLIGISPAHAPAMYRSLLTGAPVQVRERPTLAEALSGGLGDRNGHTLQLVSGLLDEVWLVSEDEIADAMIWGAERLGSAVEGAGAAALAGLARPEICSAAESGPVVAVVSGGNVDAGTVAHARRTATRPRLPAAAHETHPLHH
jgi:threonine dehydratase